MAQNTEREEGWERGHLSLESNEWLSLVARGELDVMDLVRGELANRGCNLQGKWVGFPEAEKLMREQARPKDVPTRHEEQRPDVAMLAQAFEDELEERLGKTRMGKLREDMLAWRGRPECPSQDRLDANVVMTDAFESTFGREADLESDADCTLINGAWGLARENMAIKALSLKSVRENVIAMGFDTDETRRSDSLDFRDIAVWSARSACAEAWLAGRGDGLDAVSRENARLRGENAGLVEFHGRVTEILQGVGMPSVSELAGAFVDMTERLAKTEAALHAEQARARLSGAKSIG